jgi:formylglycine-generating enzyme required for sulfatase activity
MWDRVRAGLVVLAALAIAGCLDIPPPATADADPIPCPSGRGAEMVKATSADGVRFCIDKTETTWGEYMEFLSRIAELGPQPSFCTWNSGMYPPSFEGNNPNTDPAMPVTGVDWCDAYAYCNWAGKRMCGKIGGGETTYGGVASADANDSQWFAACSGGGLKTYPYGNNYDPTLCNGEASGVIAAGTMTCEGGVSGLYNMSGNVWEWEHSCSDDVDMNDMCWARGGEFRNDMEFLKCSYGFRAPNRAYTYDSIGIRCCGP